MAGRYECGIDFSMEFGPNWRHTSDIVLNIRDQWGSPMHGYLFRIVIQAGNDPRQMYVIPSGNRFLQPDGFLISLINASIATRGWIHLTAYSPALKEFAIGSCSYQIPEPNSRQPRHPIQISARLNFRGGTSTQENNGSSTETPDTRSVSVQSGVSAVIANSTVTGTRNLGYRSITRGGSNSTSTETREPLKTFDMQQQP